MVRIASAVWLLASAGWVHAAGSTTDWKNLTDIFSLDAARFRAALCSDLPEIRVAGVQGFSYLRHYSFEPDLIAVLEDADANVRREAVLALARIGRRASVVPLIARLDDEAYEVRTQAGLALMRVTLHAPPPDSRADSGYWRDWWRALSPEQRERQLIARLDSPDDCSDALRSLARLGGPRTENALLARLEAGGLSAEQRKLLLRALEPVATTESLAALEPFVGRVPAATWAVGNIGGPQAERMLLSRLRRPQLDVLMNLDRVHSSGAFAHAPMLVRAFGLVSYRSQPDDLHLSPTPVQRLAANLLIRTGRADEIVELILAALDGKPITKACMDDPIVQALHKLLEAMEPELRPGFHRGDGNALAMPLAALPHLVRDPAITPRLIALLDHPAYVVRVYAATALGRLGASEAVAPIARILDAGYPFGDAVAQVSGKHGPKISRFVRWKGYLAMALGHIGDDAARQVLERLVVDPSAYRDIRFGAAIGLGTIASPGSRDALRSAARDDLVRWIRETASRSLREIQLRGGGATTEIGRN